MLKTSIQNSANAQQGAVLIMGLIMLLLMTIVGMAAIRGSSLQETMAGNMRERNLAFQSAEAALRVGEALVQDNNVETLDFSGATLGLEPDLLQPGALLPPVAGWSDEQWEDNAVQAALELENIPEELRPRYVVEELTVLSFNANKATGGALDQAGILQGGALNMDYFRVSGRGQSGSGQAEVIVQSTYRKN
ncbi:pilus assembly PilX family protein [Marinimicrobium locisalis]|uniref:pilus assembly PilX family protein n=1 Tax=Marinimicrobium locisalis TaxID=546022 RepID=UPI003221C9E9